MNEIATYILLSSPRELRMAIQELLVSDLSLDLGNYRTVRQKSELSAFNSMISISPDWLWGLMNSLLDDGYIRTENIIVMKTIIKSKETLVVKEGNRRIAIMKVILGKIKFKHDELPAEIQSKIEQLSEAWKTENRSVPCDVYTQEQASIVNKIVARTHGKGDKAGRDKWKAIATARHNREINQKPEPSLDLLDKYLRDGQNLNKTQKDRWAGDYPLTVLTEALDRIYSRLGATSKAELIKNYPAKLASRSKLELIMFDIGANALTFPMMRNSKIDFGKKYHLPDAASPPHSKAKADNNQKPSTSSSTQPSDSGSSSSSPAEDNPSSTTTTKGNSSTPATSIRDPKSVYSALKNFAINGAGREKVKALYDEIVLLKITKTPRICLPPPAR